MIAENNKIMPQSAQFFDNPLSCEFISVDQLAQFLGYSKDWIMMQVAEGKLTCHPVGKKLRLFHVEEVRHAILRNDLCL